VPEVRPPDELLRSAAVELQRQAPLLGEVGALFAAAGHQLYLVGGSVRDAVLGRLTTDLDFTTDAGPDKVQEIVRPWADAIWDTGIEYGTIGVGKAGQRLEITTFRADSYDQVSRNPQVRFGDRLEDDLLRRDFTVNAMAVRITADGPGESWTRWVDCRRFSSGCWTPRPRPRCPSETTRCGCCGRRGSSLSWSSGSLIGCARRWPQWLRSWGASPWSGLQWNWTRCCWVLIQWRVSS
jgi:hypothetical protein